MKKKIGKKVISLMLILVSITSIIPIKNGRGSGSDYTDSLGESFQSVSKIPIGCSVELNVLNSNEKYKNLIEYHFDTYSDNIGAANIWTGVNQYDWSDEDEYVEFAEQNDAFIYGCTLVMEPPENHWLQSFQGNTEDWKNMLKTFIQTFLSRYKGRVHSYEVVNEAFNPDGSLREILWYRKIGPEYINLAFEWAHEADPDAKLYLGDYCLCAVGDFDFWNRKLDSVIKFINESLQEGIPIHGLSFQTHLKLDWPTENDIKLALDKISQVDIDIRVSELDITLNSEDQNPEFTDELAQLQKTRYYNVVKLFYEYPRTQTITMWGVSDKYSWIPLWVHAPDWPCLFDENFDPKPAAEGFLAALKVERNIPESDKGIIGFPLWGLLGIFGISILIIKKRLVK